MAQVNYVSVFNKHFVDFLSDIEIVFPEDIDIKTAKNSVLLLQKANPSLLIKLWKKHVMEKYSSEIEAGDINFFIQKDYNSDLSKTGNSSQINEIIDRLRQPVSMMSDENKEKSIKYIQNLSKIANIYFSN